MSGADDQPLLVLSRVDKGRVGLLLSDQMWLWARGYDGGGPYLDLLRRLAHWLMKEPELEEEALRASAKGRDVTVERQSVERRGARNQSRRARRDEDEARHGPDRAGPDAARMSTVDRYGLYRAEDGAHVALVSVGPDNPLEMQDVVSTSGEAAPDRRGDRRHGAPAGLERGGAIAMPARRRPEPGGRATAAATISGSSGPDRARLIGARSTSLASGFFGLALLLGAVLAAWLAEAGRFRRGGR